ncbi:MAG: hypothetical protein MJE12_24550 [Alphaproteobacteria bacterium]|nr:hypothetical protein [Alphaproteobacteria bacterium]
MRRIARIAAACALPAMAACAPINAETVQELSAWGYGWQFTAVQNRIQPAIPPVLRFLRLRDPKIRRADLPESLGRDFRATLWPAPPAYRDLAERRLIGVFTVDGPACAAEGFPVRDEGRAVAVFVALDAGIADLPPEKWRPCAGGGLAGNRVSALRDLIRGAMEKALKSR